MQSISRLLITIILVVASGFIAYKAINISPSDEQEKPPKLSSSVLFSTSYPDVLGHAQSLNQWKGKILLVNFWATWCPPCIEEMPELSKIQEKFRDRGVIVLGISTDDLQKTKSFTDGLPVSYPILVGDMSAMDLSQLLGNNRGILPFSVLIDQNGNVVKILQGRINPETVEQLIEANLNP